MIKNPTEEYVEAELREKHGIFMQKSELKKPYLEEGFPEMEYQDYNWPNVKPYHTKYSSGLLGVSLCTHCIIITHDKTCNSSCEDCYGESHVARACFIGDPQSNNYGQQYSWYVEGSPIDHIDYYGTAICTHKVSAPKGNCIKIYPKWSAIESDGDWKKANYAITFTDGLRHQCRDKIQIKCPTCVCEEVANVAYDNDNSDDTIDREGTATVVVTDGCGPFNWSVSGTGFSISSLTEGRTNTLSADGTACGSATITVTDNCSDSCTGYVRCTEGHWEAISSGCTLSGSGTLISHTCTDCDRWWTYELIAGNKRQLQNTVQYCTGSGGVGTNCIDPTHTGGWYAWNYYEDFSVCAPDECEGCNATELVSCIPGWYYEWQC